MQNQPPPLGAEPSAWSGTLSYLPSESAAGEEDPGASIDQVPAPVDTTTMHLIQILLPMFDNLGQALPKASFDEVKQELVERFRGLTAYTQAPASGLWVQDGDRDEAGGQGKQVVKDQLVIYEVMANELDRTWWSAYRAALAQRFGQQALVVRAQTIDML